MEQLPLHRLPSCCGGVLPLFQSIIWMSAFLLQHSASSECLDNLTDDACEDHISLIATRSSLHTNSGRRATSQSSSKVRRDDPMPADFQEVQCKRTEEVCKLDNWWDEGNCCKTNQLEVCHRDEDTGWSWCGPSTPPPPPSRCDANATCFCCSSTDITCCPSSDQCTFNDYTGMTLNCFAQCSETQHRCQSPRICKPF
eukprot:TRINITY_DN51146_c0_g1_i2.p1 TRINITY_DN51146_c0_g1~~TRINITY_DN51146_c0_g1_i2.p1  ORF type:complete len:198 (+),score=19.34 TRINITY_DN51146_c0_g1_i2:125-718(+)